MPDIYDIDYNLQGQLLLPPDKRTPKHMAWVRVLLKPVQYLRDLIFNDYLKGANYLQWDNATVYNKGDRVIWRDRAVYECLLSGATGFITQPTGGFGLGTTFWIKVLDSFIGARERQAYTGQFILLELAVNRWFFNENSAFKIFVTNNVSSGAYGFSVSVYSLLWSTIAGTDADREAAVRQCIDKYALPGITYEVTQY